MNWGRGVLRVVGSCLRRNDERERRNDGRWDAGMTAGRRWCRVVGVKHGADFMTAGQRACRALAALARSGGGGG